jgi:hypothetical protein
LPIHRVLCALLLLAAPSLAAEPEPAARPGPEGAAVSDDPAVTAELRELDIRLRVSGWAAAWHGDVGASGALVSVDADLGEAFPENNFGAGAELDVRWRRFVLVAGGRWFDLDDGFESDPISGTVRPGLLDFASIDPIFPPAFAFLVVPEFGFHAAGGRIDVDVEQVEADLLLGYRIATTPLPTWLGGAEEGEARRFDLDLLGGIRYHDIETRIDVRLPGAEFDPFVAQGFSSFRTAPSSSPWRRRRS